MCADRSAIAPITGSTNTCRNTDSDTTYAKTEPARDRDAQRVQRTRRRCPRRSSQPAAFSAIAVRYGPRKTVMTVVEKAEFAQS